MLKNSNIEKQKDRADSLVEATACQSIIKQDSDIIMNARYYIFGKRKDMYYISASVKIIFQMQ